MGWSSRYWGIRAPDTSASGEYFGLARLTMRAVPAGADLCLGKTATASVTESGYPTSNLFDGNAATLWTTGIASPPSGGHWLMVDFGTPVEIVEVEMQVRADGLEQPLTFYLTWSPDGSFANTEDYSAFPAQSAWTNGEIRTFSVTDPGVATTAYASGAGAYVFVDSDAEQAISQQAGVMLVAAGETASSEWPFFAHQLGVYALVSGLRDTRDLRAWPFTQDDHDFYVLQLGDQTLVYDKLTQQWAKWKSPDKDYWRGNDGVGWEGFNVCCDTESGILWEIDADGRLDYETTPITSVCTGGFSGRMRKYTSNTMAELTTSEEPPTGVAGSSTSIGLRTSDDFGQSYVNHGSITGGELGDDMVFRWYNLGMIPAPGRLFELTNYGYARRIDGFNIEVPDSEATNG